MGTFTPTFVGDVAFVTGGSAGMGRACSMAFAAAGAQVVLCDLNDDGGHETVSLIAAAGGTAVYVRGDVSVAGDVEAAVATAVSHFGRLDCAVNAAAIENDCAMPPYPCT